MWEVEEVVVAEVATVITCLGRKVRRGRMRRSVRTVTVTLGSMAGLRRMTTQVARAVRREKMREGRSMESRVGLFDELSDFVDFGLGELLVVWVEECCDKIFGFSLKEGSEQVF